MPVHACQTWLRQDHTLQQVLDACELRSKSMMHKAWRRIKLTPSHLGWQDQGQHQMDLNMQSHHCALTAEPTVCRTEEDQAHS